MRATLAVAAAGAVAALAALILGEYEFAGWVPALGGLVVGLVVGEVVVAVGGGGRPWLAAPAAPAAAGALLWGGWLASSEGVAPYPALAWLGAAVAGVAAVARIVPLSRRSSAG